jgi:hypothetical protein
MKTVLSLLSIICVLFLASCSKDDAASKNTQATEQKNGANPSEDLNAKVEEVTTQVKEKVEEIKTEVAEKTKELNTKVEETTAKVEESTAAVKALTTGNFEVACGKCVFKDPACKECQTYVKLSDKLYPVTGLDIEPEKLGLCKTSANADVEGETKEDGSFSISSFENLKLNLPEIPKTTDDAINKLKDFGF